MFNIQKKRVRADDLVKTPVSHDMGALRRCNPPARTRFFYKWIIDN